MISWGYGVGTTIIFILTCGSSLIKAESIFHPDNYEQEVARYADEDEALLCTIVERHSYPIALLEGQPEEDEPEIPDLLIGQCNDGKDYDIWSGTTSDVDAIIDLHFDGIHPAPGMSEILVPLSAIVTGRNHGVQYIDLLKLSKVELRQVRATRSGDVTEGTFTVLVIRVITADGQPTGSKEQLSDDIFGTGILGSDDYNLKSGYEMCSGDKLIFNPAVADGVHDGVYELTLTQNANGVASGTVKNWAEAAIPSDIRASADYLYFVLQSGVEFNGAAAWAYLPGTVSAYNDEAASVYIVMMHELGHNLGHHHSGLGTAQYGDHSCWMGSHSWNDEGPSACFNGAKSWWFDWYSRASYEPTAEALELKLVGNNDYLDGEATSEHVVAVQLKEGEDELYLYYNKREGVNGGVARYGDTVTISEQEGARAISWHQAALGDGDVFERPNWAGTGKTLFIQVCSMETGTPDYARVIIYVRKMNYISCSGEPTLSPYPTQTPTTAAPTGSPVVLAMYWASGPWSNLPPEGLLSLGAPFKTDYVQTINFDDEYGYFATSGRPDNVAALFQGNLMFEDSGDYQLCVTSDDGSKLFLDGSLLIDNDGLHGKITVCTSINTFGIHKIDIEYWERTGGSALIFEWAPPSMPLGVVPASSWLSSEPTASPAPTLSNQPTSRTFYIETEDADVLSGAVIASSHSGFTGRGFVDYTASSGYIQWSYSPPTRGYYKLSLRYALASGNRPLELSVNGETQGTFDFGMTSDWSDWQYTSSIEVYLDSGPSLIRLSAIGASGPNVDHLLFELEGAGPTVSPTLKPSVRPSVKGPCEDTAGIVTIAFSKKTLSKTCTEFAAHKKFNCKKTEVQDDCPHSCGLCPAVPTISPSWKPSPSSGWPCEDSEGVVTIAFSKKTLSKTCSQFAAHKKFNCNKPDQGKPVQEACPDSCGLCIPDNDNPTPSPSIKPSPSTGACEDQEGKFTLSFNDGKKQVTKTKNCMGFAKHKKFNCDESNVREACPRTCNVCGR